MCVDWLELSLTAFGRQLAVDQILEHLDPHIANFDQLAVCGVSSIVLGSMIANALEKDLVVIRKASERRYSNNKVEYIQNGKCLFIDDSMFTGATLTRVKKLLKAENIPLVGVFYYDDRLHNSKQAGWFEDVWDVPLWSEGMPPFHNLVTGTSDSNISSPATCVAVSSGAYRLTGASN